MKYWALFHVIGKFHNQFVRISQNRNVHFHLTSDASSGFTIWYVIKYSGYACNNTEYITTSVSIYNSEFYLWKLSTKLLHRVIYNLTIYGEWHEETRFGYFFPQSCVNKTKQHFWRLFSEWPPLKYFSSSSK